jgi:hypothetical protein
VDQYLKVKYHVSVGVEVPYNYGASKETGARQVIPVRRIMMQK